MSYSHLLNTRYGQNIANKTCIDCSLIWTGGFTLGEYINGHPSMVEFYEQIKGNEALCNRLFNLPGALQVSSLSTHTTEILME